MKYPIDAQRRGDMPIFEREETLVRKIFVLCALLLFPVLCAAAPAEKWTEYINDRFGYSVEHPDIFEEAKIGRAHV